MGDVWHKNGRQSLPKKRENCKPIVDADILEEEY